MNLTFPAVAVFVFILILAVVMRAVG